MNLHRFTATNAADALGQIRSRLGAEAVVISVSRLPVHGFERLWRKPRLEVLAGLPEPDVEKTGRMACSTGQKAPLPEPSPASPAQPPACNGALCGWRAAQVLLDLGLQSVNVEKIIDRARALHGEVPPRHFDEELAVVRAALKSFWRVPDQASASSGSVPVHVFIGPPGSGKTTALCKWLARSVLAEGLTVGGWRLDSRAANFAGLLDLYGEILGIPVEREWEGSEAIGGCDRCFVDLPGANPHDAEALDQLRTRLSMMPGSEVHLILNAAYEITVLTAQIRLFTSAMPVTDLIFTHLDEEKRRGKLWNLVVGTNCAVRYLSGGQNIPGEFAVATPDLLLNR